MDAVLFRDVVERHRVTQVAALRSIVRKCLRNPGGAFSAHRLYRELVLDRVAVPRTQVPGVAVRPAWEWLLQPGGTRSA